MLLVVLAIVLLLVAQNGKEVAPTAMDVSDPGGAVDDHGQPEAAEALGELPGLDDVQQRTGAYADQLQQVLEETE
jgi:hypothetical protein